MACCATRTPPSSPNASIPIAAEDTMSSSVTNPFEDEAGIYRILMNAEAQYSLWPDFAAIPAGWHSVFGPTSRAECLAFVTASHTDPRPTSLRAGQRVDPS